MKRILFIALCLLALQSFAQHGYRDGNRIGLYGGVTYTSLMTKNFDTQPEMGWAAGMQVRGNFYNNSSMIFGMQFSENNFSTETTTPLLKKETVKYKLMGAQIRLLLSYNLVKNRVSLDFGPVLQINDKLKINKNQENNIIDGTGLNAKQITDVSKVNGNLYTGVSAGGKKVRLLLNYQYGVNNLMGKLNKNDALKYANNNSRFQAHAGILCGQLLFNL